MLEQSRPRDRAVLRDVADHERGAVGALGKGHQCGRALAHLADAAGKRLDLGHGHGLDRVDDERSRPQRFERGQDRVEVGFGEEQQFVGGAQAERAHLGLRGGLFAADVNDRALALGRQPRRDLQQQGRLARSGRAAHQDQAARHDAAAEQCVELAEAAGHPGEFVGRHVAEPHRRAGGSGDGAQAGRVRFDLHRGSREGVPGVAGRAAAQPARGLVPARRTEEDRARLCQRVGVYAWGPSRSRERTERPRYG